MSQIESYRLKIIKANYASDLWLQNFWPQLGAAEPDDQYNEIVHGFIPDMVNHRTRLIIECDGSIHERFDIKMRDERRDRILESYGYVIVRVKFGDLIGLACLAGQVLAAQLNFTINPWPK